MQANYLGYSVHLQCCFSHINAKCRPILHPNISSNPIQQIGGNISTGIGHCFMTTTATTTQNHFSPSLLIHPSSVVTYITISRPHVAPRLLKLTVVRTNSNTAPTTATAGANFNRTDVMLARSLWSTSPPACLFVRCMNVLVMLACVYLSSS